MACVWLVEACAFPSQGDPNYGRYKYNNQATVNRARRVIRYKFNKVNSREDREGHRQETDSEERQRQGKKIYPMQNRIDFSVASAR